MSDNFDPITRTSANAWDIDVGLRTHMQSVYNYMALGLGITGVTAYLTAQSPQMMQLIFGLDRLTVPEQICKIFTLI